MRERDRQTDRQTEKEEDAEEEEKDVFKGNKANLPSHFSCSCNSILDSRLQFSAYIATAAGERGGKLCKFRADLFSVSACR